MITSSDILALQDWLSHWPRQQLLIIRYEDYVAALPQHLQAVLSFLDVRQPDTTTMTSMVSARVRNHGDYPPMRVDTQEMLEAFYKPFNKILAAQLADARWMWDDASGGAPSQVAPQQTQLQAG